MENNHPEASPVSRSPIISFVVILLFALVGLFIGNIIGILSILPFYEFDLMASMAFLGDPMSDPDGKVPLLLVQGISSLCSFVLAPLGYVYLFEKNATHQLTSTAVPLVPAIILTVLISQAFMFVNTPIIEWNMNVKFPAFLSDFEAYAIQQEEILRQITEYVTEFDNFGQFMLGIIVIGVLPGVGEELLFRGLIQRKLALIFKNPHVAIWLAGFLFGLFHMQFYGLVPRMLLGVLFGYLYWWSGSLLLAMIAHFFNNAFTLTMVYLHSQGLINFDIDGTTEIPPGTILVSGVIFGLLIYYFLRHVKHKELSDG